MNYVQVYHVTFKKRTGKRGISPICLFVFLENRREALANECSFYRFLETYFPYFKSFLYRIFLLIG